MVLDAAPALASLTITCTEVSARAGRMTIEKAEAGNPVKVEKIWIIESI